jgi:hypothetical protein
MNPVLKEYLRINEIYGVLFHEFVDAGRPGDDISIYVRDKYGVDIIVKPQEGILKFEMVDEQKYGWFILRFY